MVLRDSCGLHSSDDHRSLSEPAHGTTWIASGAGTGSRIRARLSTASRRLGDTPPRTPISGPRRGELCVEASTPPGPRPRQTVGATPAREVELTGRTPSGHHRHVVQWVGDDALGSNGRIGRLLQAHSGTQDPFGTLRSCRRNATRETALGAHSALTSSLFEQRPSTPSKDSGAVPAP